jgi:hypothetical protein
MSRPQCLDGYSQRELLQSTVEWKMSASRHFGDAVCLSAWARVDVVRDALECRGDGWTRRGSGADGTGLVQRSSAAQVYSVS